MAAIYMWPVDEQILLTTTLYPVEVSDEIQIGVSFGEGYMGPLPHSEATVDFISTGGSWTQTRWFYDDGPYDSNVAIEFESSDGSWTQTRWFYDDGPYDSYAAINFAATDGLWKNKLVIADTPDEELQLGVTISADCTMEIL